MCIAIFISHSVKCVECYAEITLCTAKFPVNEKSFNTIAFLLVSSLNVALSLGYLLTDAEQEPTL